MLGGGDNPVSTVKKDKTKPSAREEAVERLRAELAIDRHDLPGELEKQPSLFFHFAEKKANAAARVRAYEEQIKVMRSKLVIRAHAKGEAVLGAGVKPTAQSVEAYYRVQPEYIALKEKLIQAQQTLDTYDGAVFALHQKKSSLDNLVQLDRGGFGSAGQSEAKERVRGRMA